MERFRVESKCRIEFRERFLKVFFPPSRIGTGAAKKKYAALAADPGGATRLALSGMEAVRGDSTRLARDFQRELLERLFAGSGYDDISKWIKSLIARLRARDLDASLIYRKRLSKDVKEYAKSAPPHIRAARMLGADAARGLREVSYVHTKGGPVPVQLAPSDIDYQHYVDKQIGPLADGVLFVFDKSFKDVVEGRQLALF